MKRIRPKRPSGTKRSKTRRRCLKCDRFMSRSERGWSKPRQRVWKCVGCGLFYGYFDGELKGLAGKSTEGWWETRGNWKMIPEGMLLVLNGTPEP